MLALSVFILLLSSVYSQYRLEDPRFTEFMDAATNELISNISSHPDVNIHFHPERKFLFNSYYTYDPPIPQDYRINIIVDPCRDKEPDCCMNVFGTTEYHSLIQNNLEAERVIRYPVLADESDVAVNYQLVYEDGSSVPFAAQRTPDDEAVFDYECLGRNDPHTYCMGPNYAFTPSQNVPACTNRNLSLDTLAGCYFPDGTYQDYCVQIAYTQTAFIAQCNDFEDDHCGTFLEIHQMNGSPYQEEEDIISEVRVTTQNVSGYFTTVMPLTWMGDQTKVLCTYTEPFFRVGSVVYVNPTAPVCCCPRAYKPATREGSFYCPKSSRGNGPYAQHFKVLADIIDLEPSLLAYPFCHNALDGPDRVMFSDFDVENMRFYTRDAYLVNETERANAQISASKTYGSADLEGNDYEDICEYFPNCAFAADGRCRKNDLLFSFIGRVGVVTAIDSSGLIPIVSVTFNDHRSSYKFKQTDLKLETRRSMYEIWWVLRTPSKYVVLKRNGFNITSPACTFDVANSRYYPYTKLADGVPIE